MANMLHSMCCGDKRAVVIGDYPGILAQALLARGFSVFGVDPANDTTTVPAQHGRGQYVMHQGAVNVEGVDVVLSRLGVVMADIGLNQYNYRGHIVPFVQNLAHAYEILLLIREDLQANLLLQKQSENTPASGVGFASTFIEAILRSSNGGSSQQLS
ncbi:uncharacterized protein N7496_010915 [Penicillium cataractarum]|uniref:Uncharacterized protein n=1 Tax=Penicillium cataractarum TaxID=2100454 RepID=A0A9W9REG0_9EURO|nr:uncharacterized protein N7496_010915 [Penicillium cataractarum]KAJ5358502.1 hypothetical protein N7496_010915 [Penicillium cataractarum]